MCSATDRRCTDLQSRDKKDSKTTKRVFNIVGRIIRGAFSGAIAFVIFVILPQYIFMSIGQLLPPVSGGTPIGSNPYLLPIGLVIFALAFVGAATYGTIIPGACTVARTVTSIVFLLILMNGGVMTFGLPNIAVEAGVTVSATIVLDFRIFLVLYIIVSGVFILTGILESISALLGSQEKASPIVEDITPKM